MKRKTRTVIASLALAGALALPALAANVIAPAPDTKAEADLPDYTYAISVNGQEVDASATVMVPLRAVAESLGFTVTWDNGTILVDNGVIHTYVVLGQDSYTITTSNENLVGMSAPFSLGIAPFSVDNVTYVPLGLFSALLGDQAITWEDGSLCIQSEDVQIPNPFTSCDSLDDAAAIAGFTMTMPDRLPNWIEESSIRASETMIEVVYNGRDGQQLRLRKAVGDDDISGDYTSYPQEETVTVNGREVTLKGEDGKVNVAIWQDDSYTYAVLDSTGMSKANITALAGMLG